MADKSKDSPEMSPEKALGLLSEVRNRLSTVAGRYTGCTTSRSPPGRMTSRRWSNW